MILLKQKRKTYMPPEIEVTEYEVDDSLAEGSNITGDGKDQEGDDDWPFKSKSYNSFDDFDDDYADGSDFDYNSYRKQMLW